MDRATRDGYGDALLKLGAGNRNVIVLDAGVSDSTRTNMFQKQYPERFFNMGISEADMVCTAAGFATCGKTAFATSFACFLVGRSLDQIKIAVAYSNTNVKIVGSHAGIATGPDGPTGQTIQDVAWLRSMPNMVIVSPCDALEAEKATIALAQRQGPAYLRLARSPVPTITKDEDFVVGRGKVMVEGKDVALIGSGIIMHEVLKAAEQLKGEGISAAVVNMATIKPLDAELVRKLAAETGALVTAEDHSVIGGLGSAVAEVLAEQPLAVLERIGVKDVFAESGSGEELYAKYGLDAAAIVKAAKAAVEKKVAVSA